MKKYIALLLTLVLALTLFAGCTPKTEEEQPSEPATTEQEPAQEQDLSILGDDQTFVVGFDQDFPPYGYVGADGEFTGFDIEMAKELASRLGWEIKLQPIDWDAKDLELESGAIDCIWNGFTINGREDKYTWSIPYVDNSQVFVVKSESGIASFDDLAGKIVSVQKDSSALAALNEEDNAELLKSFEQLIEVAEYNTAFMDLEQGAVDAIAMDKGVAQFQMKGREDQFTILDKTLYDEQYGIGFLLGNTALKDAVEAELINMVSDGTVTKISEQFFDGVDVCIIEAK